MSIFKFKKISSGEKTLLVYSLSKKNQVEFSQIKTLRDSGFYDCFLPFDCTKSSKNSKINFNITGLVPLNEFLKGSISQENYFGIVSGIKKVVDICRKNFFPIENIVFTPKYIYYHETSGKILMAYIPVENEKKKAISGKGSKLLLSMHKSAKINITDGSMMNEYESYLGRLRKNSKCFPPEELRCLSGKDLNSHTVQLNASFDKNDNGSSNTVLRVRASTQHGKPFLLDKSGKKILISKLPFKIGRSKSNDLVIDSDMVSAHHAKIIQEGDEFYIEDCDSANGTYLNDIDNKIKRSRIVDSNKIFFDMFEYTFKTVKTKVTANTDSMRLLSGTESEIPLAYIKKVSDDSVIKVMRYPFISGHLPGLIFFSKQFAGETLLYVENVSCQALRLENVDIPIGESTEIFSGCSLFIDGELYTFSVEN